jgi:hypothetical protein
MYTITLPTIAGVLLVYVALFVVITRFRGAIEAVERKTALVVGGTWAVSTFVGNYLLFRVGLMSFLPWVNNFMHTFIWIGVCLTWLYLGVRERQSMVVQCLLFAGFSLVVKYAEHFLFGTWDLDHFLHIFRGNFAYIMGWSLADGLYPVLTLYGLRLVSTRISGLVVM